MIKCVDKGEFTCISRNGIPKKSYDTDNAAIAAAKIVNGKDPKPDTKLVAYKCCHCQKYHLLTTKIKINNMNNRQVIKVEVPKEIWDADMSIWNVLFGRRDIMGAWMKSIVSVVNQIKQ